MYGTALQWIEKIWSALNCNKYLTVRKALNCIKLYWAVLNCIELYWKCSEMYATMLFFELYWTVLISIGLSWNILTCIGLYWAIINCIESIRLYWTSLHCQDSAAAPSNNPITVACTKLYCFIALLHDYLKPLASYGPLNTRLG